MPVAKPHKKALSTKKFKPDTSAWNPDIMTENMYALIDYLQKRGDLRQVMTEAYPWAPDVSAGAHLKDSPGDIAVIAGSPASGNAVFAHEIAHAITKGKYKPRTQRIAETIGKDSISRYALPSWWFQKRVGAANIYNNLDNLELRELFRKAASQRQYEVRASIPSNETWSGLKPLKGKNYYHTRSGDEESKAWYFADRDLSKGNPVKLASPRNKRAKEYGLFLRDYGVPMNIVAPVVEDLIAAPNPTERYFGGSANINRLILRERNKK